MTTMQRLQRAPFNARHAAAGGRWCRCGSPIWRRLRNRTGLHMSARGLDGRQLGENGDECRCCFLEHRVCGYGEFIPGDGGVESRAEGNEHCFVWGANSEAPRPSGEWDEVPLWAFEQTPRLHFGWLRKIGSSEYWRPFGEFGAWQSIGLRQFHFWAHSSDWLEDAEGLPF